MSSSRSSSATSTENRDGRVAVDGQGNVGVSADGDVNVHMVADEAWQLGLEAIQEMKALASGSIEAANDSTEIVGQTLSQALFAAQEAGKSEATQLSSQMMKMAIPAAALAFVAAKVLP